MRFCKYHQRFQSPKSGKFESNNEINIEIAATVATVFQSPRSGKFESNNLTSRKL